MDRAHRSFPVTRAHLDLIVEGLEAGVEPRLAKIRYRNLKKSVIVTRFSKIKLMRLTAGLQKVNVQLELSKPASQVVLNN